MITTNEKTSLYPLLKPSMIKVKYFLMALLLIVIGVLLTVTHYYPLDRKPTGYWSSRFLAHTVINGAGCNFPEKDDNYEGMYHYNFSCGGSIWTDTPTEATYTLYVVPNDLLKNKYIKILNKKFGEGLIVGEYYLIKGYLTEFDYFSNKKTPDPIKVYKRFNGQVR